MERLSLEKPNKTETTYSRKTARMALEGIVQRINEVNKNEEFIYKITKAVLFGSYINSTKEKIGDLDIAIYVELKDKSIPEIEQNQARARTSYNYVPFMLSFIYGKEEVFKYIKNKKRVLELHDGVKVDEDATKYNEPISYIYLDKNKVIYEEV
jgi:predicted nucleotidyltransferase